MADGVLPGPAGAWVKEHCTRFGDLAEMGEDEGFFGGSPEGAYIVSAPPDPKYDGLRGTARLEVLESAWATASEWGDDPAWRWLEQDGRTAAVLADFRATGDGGASFPRVWLRFGRWLRESLWVKDGSVLPMLANLPDERDSVRYQRQLPPAAEDQRKP